MSVDKLVNLVTDYESSLYNEERVCLLMILDLQGGLNNLSFMALTEAQGVTIFD